jgi:hypothetical protein
MAGKKRSGLANDRRAYGCGRIYKPPTPVCPSITITDIATYDGSFWVLNNNTTILACQTLTIDLGTLLVVPPGLTLINNGTIVNNYIFGNFYGGAITNNGTIANYGNGGGLINISNLFINNGIINVLNNSTFANSPGSGESDVTITNNGNINIALGGILSNTNTLINNYSGGNINNRGTIENDQANINNAGGTITNYSGGTIISTFSSIIYNNNGGIINNNSGATFTNDGTISNADGSSYCGIGIINGTILGTIDAQCPPP